MAKICPTCGAPFTDPKHPNRRFCSNVCRVESHRRDVVCAGCGQIFRTSQNNLNKGRRYCTRECAYKHAEHPRNPAKREKRFCERCGKEFECWTYRTNRYCSYHCAQSIPEAHITKACEVCGKSYTVIRYFVTKRTSNYCSNECKAIANSRIKIGAGNPNYRGGTVLYRGANWGRQRRKTVRRDGYTCQICGYKGKPGKRDVDAHHINPYRNYNGDYEQANQLNNLITLCKPCHGKVEAGKLACPKRLL